MTSLFSPVLYKSEVGFYVNQHLTAHFYDRWQMRKRSSDYTDKIIIDKKKRERENTLTVKWIKKTSSISRSQEVNE